MITLETRLATVVALLPPSDKARLAAPLGPEESTDTRLVEAVRALAKAEGLTCMTPAEFSRAVVQQAAQRAMPATKPPAADEKPEDDLAARFAAIIDPRAQTAFWRSLTAEQRAAISKAK
jgi:hypothetical protein